MEPIRPLAVFFIVSIVLTGAVLVWGEVFVRWRDRRPILPVEPRRQVPWTGLDLVLVFVVYLVGSLAAGILFSVLGGSMPEPSGMEAADASDAVHPVMQLLREAGGPTVFLLVLTAVVIAPITEEILFRLFLQGWLEKFDRNLRGVLPVLIRLVHWGTLPVLLSAFLFASIHFRGKPVRLDPNTLLYFVAANGAIKIGTVAFAVAMAVLFRGATAKDLGWDSKRFVSDIGLGIRAFFAIAPPIYLLQASLASALPTNVTPDPFALFPLALVLGILYLRTHRITPAIVAHMGLNGVSMAIAMLSIL